MSDRPSEADCSSTPIHDSFGISRQAYFVIPRLALEAMPAEWQRRFVALMIEAEESGLETPNYHVLRDDKAYTSTQPNDSEDPTSWDREFYIQQKDEWANYRRGNIADLCPSFKLA